VVSRFLQAGEGRVDHIAGYLDGFELWRSLAASGIKGIVRGDEAFGNNPVATIAEARIASGLTPWNEIPGVPSFRALGLGHLGEPRIPANLEPALDEAPTDWRDRVEGAYQDAYVWAALNDLKDPYLEVASPLMARRIVEAARSLPQHLRTSKRLFCELAAERAAGVPYATERATEYAHNALAAPAMAELLLDEMDSRPVRERLSPAFADFVIASLRHPSAAPRGPERRARIKHLLGPFVHTVLRALFRGRPPRPICTPQMLAFRACIITRMCGRLSADATPGRGEQPIAAFGKRHFVVAGAHAAPRSRSEQVTRMRRPIGTASPTHAICRQPARSNARCEAAFEW